jgi:hypothetical protein
MAITVGILLIAAALSWEAVGLRKVADQGAQNSVADTRAPESEFELASSAEPPTRTVTGDLGFADGATVSASPRTDLPRTAPAPATTQNSSTASPQGVAGGPASGASTTSNNPGGAASSGGAPFDSAGTRLTSGIPGATSTRARGQAAPAPGSGSSDGAGSRPLAFGPIGQSPLNPSPSNPGASSNGGRLPLDLLPLDDRFQTDGTGNGHSTDPGAGDSTNQGGGDATHSGTGNSSNPGGSGSTPPFSDSGSGPNNNESLLTLDQPPGGTDGTDGPHTNTLVNTPSPSTDQPTNPLASVPEPAEFALLSIAAVMTLRRFKRLRSERAGR